MADVSSTTQITSKAFSELSDPHPSKPPIARLPPQRTVGNFRESREQPRLHQIACRPIFQTILLWMSLLETFKSNKKIISMINEADFALLIYNLHLLCNCRYMMLEDDQIEAYDFKAPLLEVMMKSLDWYVLQFEKIKDHVGHLMRKYLVPVLLVKAQGLLEREYKELQLLSLILAEQNAKQDDKSKKDPPPKPKPKTTTVIRSLGPGIAPGGSRIWYELSWTESKGFSISTAEKEKAVYFKKGNLVSNLKSMTSNMWNRSTWESSTSFF